MNVITIVRKVGPIDLKNVLRDSILVWVFFIPLGLAFLIRLGVPALATFVRRETGFDLAPYYPLLMSGFAVMMPGIVGTVIGFLLLDERDEQVLTALQVTPMPPGGYLAYRIGLPLLVGFVLTLVCYPIAGLAPIPLIDLLAVTLLASFTAPLMALFLASFAPNKVTGFAMMKMINAVEMTPMLAFFVDGPLQLVAGIMPVYWPMKMLWLAAAGESYGAYLLAGIVVNLIALALLLKRFGTVVHR